nr:hypothetical protein [uncultured Caproiciproducens sp.]
MYFNLDAEQARRGHTNQYVADILEISRVSYESKKKSGKFTVPQIKQLCKMYDCDFSYLFDSSRPQKSA